MKNINKFYAKLADLMDEYDVVGFYGGREDSVYVELPNNETPYFYSGVEPKFLRGEAGLKVLSLGGDVIGTVKPIAIGKGVKVAVSGVIEGRPVNEVRARLLIDPIDDTAKDILFDHEKGQITLTIDGIDIYDVDDSGRAYTNRKQLSKHTSESPVCPTHHTLKLLKRALLSSEGINVRDVVNVFSSNAGEISISKRNALSIEEYKKPNVKTIAYVAGDTVDALLSRYKAAIYA